MIKGDKIRLVKSMGAFTDVGEICEVIGVAEGGVISFKFGGVHLGCMSYDEYKKYFEKVENPINPLKKPCTNWSDEKILYTNLDGDDISEIIQYRENGIRVQVRCDDINSRSSCYSSDEFDLSKGLELATRRLIVKLLSRDNKIYAKRM